MDLNGSVPMRALVISDIHSNLEALNAVLAAAPPHDVIWNLGDVVGYGASPNEVIDCVQPLGTLVVRGNHDRACGGLGCLRTSAGKPCWRSNGLQASSAGTILSGFEASPLARRPQGNPP
jgi:hypothetical protein